MYEAYCTYVDDNHFDNHEYDDDTDADTDYDTGDDTDDDINTHIIVRSRYLAGRPAGYLAGHPAGHPAGLIFHWFFMFFRVCRFCGSRPRAQAPPPPCGILLTYKSLTSTRTLSCKQLLGNLEIF